MLLMAEIGHSQSRLLAGAVGSLSLGINNMSNKCCL